MPLPLSGGLTLRVATMHLDMKSHTGGTMSLVKGICVLALPKAVYQHKKLDGSRTCQSR
jgi:hypothetical protein